MRVVKKCLAWLLAASMTLGVVYMGPGIGKSESMKVAKAATKTLTINGKTKVTRARSAYRGLGAVTCNSSSRLLMDYKEKNPKAYWEIMNWLFQSKTGAGLSHIKIELGCDSDTSSGAEPATKRTSAQKANVRRGAGYMFAHDALTINPNITVDMLCWGMPAWVEQAYEKSNQAGYKARYKWYKETIDAAYDTWGIKFSYVSANRNEKSIEKGWTKYLSKSLKNEKIQRYDYSKIKIVAADETDNMYVADEMLKDKAYRNAVDVIGCHYNSYMNSKVKKLHKKYKKEIWFSEGASVATDAIFGANNTTDGQTTSGTNGMLDIANRIIIGMAQSNMTMYEFQPAVASYYDGAVYYPKQLISANDPWSGYYSISNGLVMAMHFTSFIQKGWKIVDSGSYGDGTQTDHYITNTKDNYLTAMSNTTGDYSTVITNDSKTSRTYKVKVSNVKKASSKVAVWETRSSGKAEAYDAHWLKKTGTLTPKKEGSVYTYTVTVKPYSMVTLTTTTGQKSYAERKAKTSADKAESNTALAIPYEDDFEYSSAFIRRRGGTPLYTNDLNGAFEVIKLSDGNHVLQQKINKDHLSSGWSGTPVNPTTSLGDDTWRDYIVSADIMLDPDENGKNYAAICARYNTSASSVANGYWFRLYRSGSWALYSNQGKIAKGSIKGMREGRLVNLKLKVNGNTITAYINNVQVAQKTITVSPVNSGRIALGSAYYKNCFDNIKVTPIEGGIENITRVDDMDSAIQFTGSVDRLQSQSYINYGRTVATLKKTAAAMSYTFKGTGVSFIGANTVGPKVRIILDGAVKSSSYAVKETGDRTAFYQINNLTYGTHTIKLQMINSEALNIDAVEVSNKKYSTKVVSAENITAKNSAISLAYGESVSLGVATTPEKAIEGVTYTTSNMAVAMVSSGGKVHGNGAGTAVVTAISDNGRKVSVKVTVTQLAISPRSGIRVGAGEKVSLKASYLKGINKAKITKWKSSNKKLATVTSKGVVKTKKAGYVTITAVGANGYQGKVVVHIRKAPYRIKAVKKITLKKGKKKQIRYSIPEGCSATKITYKSSKKSVASITKSGVVKAKKSGKCTIIIKAYNGKKAKIKVTVK